MGLPETQRVRRGHDFYPPDMEKMPALYSTEKTATADKIVHLHYFCAAGDWWITEVDPKDGMAFGFAKMSYGEWGSIYLPELEEVNAHGGLVIVERDLYWEPKKFSDVSHAG